MSLIASHPYIKVERHVTGLEQKQIEHERYIHLYRDKVVTKYHEFPLSQVMDMSYRSIGNKGGLLYLHTNKGVYTYPVKSTPRKFIDSFKLVNEGY
ncbi:hypothetical protein [Sediminibacillus massiliensis]|uniref:hypothetical protein n=1 Tax=Sediminibacillus massiliensis TaxID=1926277 RepID=UPI0009885EFE|nr:hypothetical protein [Sediminibacillus massiliensis]